MSPRLRGILYTVGSAASLSVTFIASKQALADLSLLGFAPLWFALAFLWGLGYYCVQPDKVSAGDLKRHWKLLVLLGLSSSAANYFFFAAVNLGNPTVVAFCSRATTIFALLMGVVLLRERLTRFQWAGALVAVVGAGLMTYQGGRLIWTILSLSLTASFFHALTSYIAKRSVIHISPVVLNVARTLGLMICLSVASLLAGELVWPGRRALLWMLGGAFFGPFLSYLLFYRGMVTLGISQGAIIRASQPLFVALYSFILFGELLHLRQFAGGLIILWGVTMTLWASPRLRLPRLSLRLSLRSLPRNKRARIEPGRHFQARL